MKIEYIKKIVLESSKHWESKGYGAIFVEKEENIRPVYDYLVNQDNYWERNTDKNELIKIFPEKISKETLDSECLYVGKTDIDDIEAFVKAMEEKNINVFILSYYRDPNHEDY